jgi:hypothetical protein
MIGIVVLHTLLMGAIILLVEYQIRESIMEEFLRRGFSIAKNLSLTNTSYVSTYNYVKIRQSEESE